MKKACLQKLIIFWVSLSIIIFSATAQPQFIKKKLDAYILQGMKDWDIPGLAIAIIKDGKIIWMKGYGVKDLETKEPVDENTLFLIASNTKLFTGTALAQLEFNKKLSLNDKVTKYFPGFQLYDSNSTALVTIKDLLSHRIGTKTFQGDFTFWNSTYSRREIINKIRLLKPTGQFRQDFGYCNSCFLTAGEIIPVVSGKPWEVYIYDSIIVPLQMTHTQTLSGNAGNFTNIARPYTTLYTGTLQRLPYDMIDNIAPAGSLVSCVSDVAKWLQMQLDTGRYESKQIIPQSVILKTRDANIITGSRKSAVYPIHLRGYGLGIFTADYNGRQIYYHTGGAFGFVTNTCFVPEENLGITILTNNDGQNFFELLRYQILDAYLGVPYVNRQTTALEQYKKDKKEAAAFLDTMQTLQKNNAVPPLAINTYTGKYSNPVYGNIEIEKQSANQLKINFLHHSKLEATLTYLGKDDWELRYNSIGYGIFRSQFKSINNKVVSILIKATDFIEYDPYLFTKME